MRKDLVRVFCSVILLLSVINAFGQEEEYQAEIGAAAGGSYYLGDANVRPFVGVEPSFGLIYRQKLTPRYGMSLQWDRTVVSGSEPGLEFNNPVNVLNLCAEYNFFDHEDKIYKPNSRKRTFYIFSGIGSMLYSSESQQRVSFSIPVGIGYKIMLGQRFNLNLIWTHTLLLADDIEGRTEYNNFYNLNGSNIFNNDWVSTFKVALTVNIWKKDCNCLRK